MNFNGISSISEESVRGRHSKKTEVWRCGIGGKNINARSAQYPIQKALPILNVTTSPKF